MNRLILLTALLAFLVTPCAADAFRLHGTFADAPAVGTAYLQEGPRPRLRLMLGERVISLQGQALPEGGYTFTEVKPTAGLADTLTTDAPVKPVTADVSFTLHPTPRGFQTERSAQGDVLELIRIDATGKARVLLVASVYDTGLDAVLLDYARRLKRYYASQGHPVDIVRPKNAQAVVDHLERSALKGVRYRRLISIGHGGWDGPSFGDSGQPQMSSRLYGERFAAFVAALNTTLTRGAKVFVSSCHAAGSDRFELANQSASIPYYNWVLDLAIRTRRTVAGPAGPTSTDYTYQHVLAILEGSGVVKQEVHVSKGDNLLVVLPGRTLAGGRAKLLPALVLTHTVPAQAAPPHDSDPAVLDLIPEEATNRPAPTQAPVTPPTDEPGVLDALPADPGSDPVPTQAPGPRGDARSVVVDLPLGDAPRD